MENTNVRNTTKEPYDRPTYNGNKPKTKPMTLNRFTLIKTEDHGSMAYKFTQSPSAHNVSFIT